MSTPHAKMPEPDGWTGTCPTTGKRQWTSRKTAKRAERRVRGLMGRMNAYRCEECGAWHLGHLPEAVIAGHVGRDELRGDS